MKLDEKGRCCGRVPIRKDRLDTGPMPVLFLRMVSQEYGIDGTQKQNWAWKKNAAGEFHHRNRSLNNET